EDGMITAQLRQPGNQVHEILILLNQAPVEPRKLVVLAVGVVVALLRAAHLVAAEQHRYALGKEERRQEVALLAGAAVQHVGVVGRALDATVPRAVEALAVVVVLAVGLVVLLVERDEVAQRETIVGGDEVDAVVGPPATGLVQIGAPRQPVAELAERAGLGPPEVPDRVTELAVPLRPQGREV